MPYDSSLDESLYAKSWGSEEEKVTVSVRCYNKGAKKLQLSRENRNAQGEMRFAKLGRLTKDEVEGILPIIQEALKEMN